MLNRKYGDAVARGCAAVVDTVESEGGRGEAELEGRRSLVGDNCFGDGGWGGGEGGFEALGADFGADVAGNCLRETFGEADDEAGGDFSHRGFGDGGGGGELVGAESRRHCQDRKDVPRFVHFAAENPDW